MALEDIFGSLSAINPNFSTLTTQGFFYDVLLPFISIFFAFYFLLGALRIFRTNAPNALLAAVFSFISTFLFTLGFFGFWIGLMGIAAFRIRGFFWKVLGMTIIGVYLFMLPQLPLNIAFFGGISAFLSLLILIQGWGTKSKVFALILVLIFYILTTAIQFGLPVSPGLQQFLEGIGAVSP